MRQLPWGWKDILWHKPAVSALRLGYAASFHKTSFLQKVLMQSWISASFLKVILYSLQFCLLYNPLLLHFLTQPTEYFLSEVIIFTKPWIFTNFIYHARSTSQGYIQNSFCSCFLYKRREKTVLCTTLQKQAPFLSNSNTAMSVNVSILEIPHERCVSPFSQAFLICLASWCAFLSCPQGLQQFPVISLYPFLFFT